jgi:hypothetical protein
MKLNSYNKNRLKTSFFLSASSFGLLKCEASQWSYLESVSVWFFFVLALSRLQSLWSCTSRAQMSGHISLMIWKLQSRHLRWDTCVYFYCWVLILRQESVDIVMKDHQEVNMVLWIICFGTSFQPVFPSQEDRDPGSVSGWEMKKASGDCCRHI